MPRRSKPTELEVLLRAGLEMLTEHPELLENESVRSQMSDFNRLIAAGLEEATRDTRTREEAAGIPRKDSQDARKGI